MALEPTSEGTHDLGWAAMSVHLEIARDAETNEVIGVDSVVVTDHRLIDGVRYSAFQRQRRLDAVEAATLWDAVATKTFADWLQLINQNAEVSP